MPITRTINPLPLAVARSLAKLGRDINIGRRKRRITVTMMTERLGVSKPTYLRVERGDPTVSMGSYAMALFALGIGTPLADLADPGADDQGLLLETERLPRRVRAKKEPRTL